MSEFKGTPGPWRIEETASTTKGANDFTLYSGMTYLGTLIEGSDVSALQERGWLPLAEAQGNARLIVASLDLLDVCQEAEKWLAEHGNQIQIGTNEAVDPWPLLDAIRHVIAKAKGEQP